MPDNTVAKKNASDSPAVKDLIKQIQGEDEETRAKAWQHAFVAGPGAVRPLASLMTDPQMEIGRAAKRGLWKIVRHAGRTGADPEKARVIAELLTLLGDDQPRAVRAEIIWMLSEIGSDECVAPLAALLSNRELREDARMALQRIEGTESLAALKVALETVSEDFKINIAQSLRQRGAQVPGLPCRKLTPVKETQVRPAGR